MIRIVGLLQDNRHIYETAKGTHISMHLVLFITHGTIDLSNVVTYEANELLRYNKSFIENILIMRDPALELPTYLSFLTNVSDKSIHLVLVSDMQKLLIFLKNWDKPYLDTHEHTYTTDVFIQLYKLLPVIYDSYFGIKEISSLYEQFDRLYNSKLKALSPMNDRSPLLSPQSPTAPVKRPISPQRIFNIVSPVSTPGTRFGYNNPFDYQPNTNIRTHQSDNSHNLSQQTNLFDQRVDERTNETSFITKQPEVICAQPKSITSNNIANDIQITPLQPSSLKNVKDVSTIASMLCPSLPKRRYMKQIMRGTTPGISIDQLREIKKETFSRNDIAKFGYAVNLNAKVKTLYRQDEIDETPEASKYVHTVSALFEYDFDCISNVYRNGIKKGLSSMESVVKSEILSCVNKCDTEIHIVLYLRLGICKNCRVLEKTIVEDVVHFHSLILQSDVVKGIHELYKTILLKSGFTLVVDNDDKLIVTF